jgi:hypothetical protein
MLMKNEIEYKQALAFLHEEYKLLQSKFDDHDRSKELEYKKIIAALKKNYDKEIERYNRFYFSLYPDKLKLLKYIRSLESLSNKYKMNEIKYNQDTQEINKIIEDKEKKEKHLKQELARLKKYLRHLPPERQVHVYKDVKISSNQS